VPPARIGTSASVDGAAEAVPSDVMSTPTLVETVGRTHLLNDVRTAIPAACYERSRSRAIVATIQAVLLYAAPITALVLSDRWWVLAVCWPLAGLGVAGLFVLGHDASHGVLVRSPRANRLLARVLMAPSLHAEAAWDLGHNRIHHGYTTRQGFDFVWHPVTVEEYEAMGRLGRLRHRLEWSWAGSGAAFLRTVWWDKMWHFSPPGKRRAAIRRDKAVLAASFGAVLGTTITLAWLDGGPLHAVWLACRVLVVPFLIFIQIIGWTVYVHHVAPDIRWWTRREWTQFRGQMESTTVLQIPAPLNVLWFHNIFVHVPHHVDTRIRFDHLPAAAAAIDAAYPDTVRTSRMSLRRYIADTRVCKLYDFEAGAWYGYPSARGPESSSARSRTA